MSRTLDERIDAFLGTKFKKYPDVEEEAERILGEYRTNR
jgi:hypothetical protein